MTRTAFVLLTGVIIAIAAHSLFMVNDLGAQHPVHGDLTSHHRVDISGPLGETAQAEVCPESTTFVTPTGEPSGFVAINLAPHPFLQNSMPLTRAATLSFLRPDTTCALFQVFRL